MVPAFKSLARVFSSATLILITNCLVTSWPAEALAQNTVSPTGVMPDPTGAISPARTRARNLFRALTGLSLPVDDPRLKKMETLIQQGKDREAAAIATSDTNFLDIRVRDMARKMSNREESIRVPDNDFVATLVGIVRDSDTTSAKEMLTGNFYYRADRSTDVVATDDDLINSNKHYQDINSKGYSLAKVLVREDGQRTAVVQGNGNNAGSTGAISAHPDPAGLLTTRQWVAAHAIAGTNRRMVEYTFRQFLCTPISSFADIEGPEDRIGRDVDRNPGGDHEKYLTTCRGCHSQQDPLRGAFAYVEFNSGRGQPLYFSRVAAKYSNNATVFPSGYVTTDTSWRNNITNAKNSDQFGWNGPMTGKGMGEFGAMIANSKGFSRCMVRRVFASVCKRDPGAKDETLVRKLAEDFEGDRYHMRRLFESVALRPECLGSM